MTQRTQKRQNSTSSSLGLMLALEPRFMFDAAGATTGAEIAADQVAQQQVDQILPPQAPVEQLDSQVDTSDSHAILPSSQEQSVTSLNERSQLLAIITNATLPATTATREIVFIDTRVENYQSLLTGINPGAQLVLLDSNRDGIEQITGVLSQYQQVDAVHIISHGSEGQLTLGNSVLNIQTMQDIYKDDLAVIGKALSSNADILIYGCNFAAGSDGLQAVNQLAQLTGADVAASNDATGAAALGGDWLLETTTGAIEAFTPFTDTALASFDGLLAAPTITDSVVTTRTIYEDTDLAITGVTIADGDVGNQTVTLTSTTGTLTLAGTSGLSGLSGNGTGTVTFTGSVTDVNAAINGLIFRGLSNASGAANFDIATNDGSTTVSRTINVTITSTNDVPAFAGGAPLSVTEGGSANFTAATNLGSGPVGFTQSNLGLSDVDNTQNQVIIKVAGLPIKGTIKLNGNELSIGSTFAVSQISQLSYTHGGGQVLSNTTDTFLVTVDDGAGGLLLNQTVTVNITPANQAPSVTGTVTVFEGEQDVSLTANTNLAIPNPAPRGAISASDPDDSTFTYSITSLTSHGTLKYNGVAIASASVGSPFAVANLALLTYSHDGNEPPANPDSFDIKITDNGGGASTPLTTTSTIQIGILGNNDDPVLTTDITQTLGGGASNLTITPAMLLVTDTDSTDATLTYTLMAVPNPADGYFTLNGNKLVVGSSFTQAAIAAGNLNYFNLSAAPRTDSISFTVKDGESRLFPTPRDGGIYDPGTNNLTANTFSINITNTASIDSSQVPGDTPVSVAPATGGTNSASLLEGATFILSSTELAASDPDNTPAQLVYRLLSLPTSGTVTLNGTALGYFDSFTQADINAGNVRFVHAGGEDFVDSFTYSVSDGTTGTSVQTFNLAITPQNDTPSASVGTRIFGPEGSALPITNVNIVLSDADNSASDNESGYAVNNALKFRITGNVSHGTLTLNGNPITINVTEVTAAQLAAGNLVYAHDSSENFSDSFKLVPIDDQGIVVATATNQVSTGAELIVPITLTPINDAPQYQNKSQLISGQAGAITEGSTATIGGALSYTNTNGIVGAGTPTSPANTVAHLVYGDNDNSTEQRQYRVTTAPANGSLLLSGSLLSVGSIFTQADLDSGNITYRHDGSETASDYFEYIVSDGDFVANDGGSVTQGNTPTPSRYNIELVPANDKPTVGAAASTLDVTANGSSYVNVPAVSVTDLDLAVITSGETDFLRVEISVLDNSNAAVAGAKITYTASDPASPRQFLSGKDTNTLVIQGTKAEIDAILSSLQVANTSDRDVSNDKLHIVVDDRLYNTSGTLDSGANGGTLNQDGTPIDAANNRISTDLTLLVSNVNDLPIISNASAYSVNEDAQLTLSGFTLSDADSFGKDVTVTVTLYSDASHTTPANASTQGAINIVSSTGLTSATGTGTNTVTLVGSMANVQSALNALQFQGAADFNNGPVYLRTTFTDFGHADVPAGNTVSVDNTINIIPVNDAPVLTGTGTTFTMGTGSSLSISGISFQDSKDTSQGASDNFYTVTVVAPTAGDSLAATASGSASSTYDSGSHTLTITGNRVDINSTLANLVYSPANSNADATYVLNVTVDDRDAGAGNGKETTGIDGNNTAAGTITVFVSGINDPAQISASNVTVNEGSATLNLTGAVGAFNVVDSDDNGAANLSATVTVSQGTISAVGGSGGTVTGTGTATVTITGATEAQLNARLQALTVTYPDETGSPASADWNGSFNVTVTVNDGGNTGQRPSSLSGDTNNATANPGDFAYADGSSAQLVTTRTITVTVNPVNDAPTRTDANPILLPSVSEDAPGGSGNNPAGDTVISLFGTKFIDSLDGITGGSAVNSLAGIAVTTNNAIVAQGTWQYSSDGNNWSNLPVVSTASAFLLKTTDYLRFVPAADFHGTPGGLSLRLVDDSGGALTTGNTANVSNDTTLSGGTTPYSNSSNAVSLNTSITPVNDAPSISGNTSFSATPEDATSATRTAANIAASLTYSDATDNRSGIGGGGNSGTSQTALAIVGNAATAAQGTWQYTLDGGGNWNTVATSVDATTAIVLNLSNTNHQVRFVPASDYNGTPGSLTVRAADGTWNTTTGTQDISSLLGGSNPWSSNTATVGITVSPVNDAPVLTAAATNPSVTENNQTATGNSIEATPLLQGISVSDIDLSTTPTLANTVFGAGTITVSFTDAYVAGDVLFIDGALPSGVTLSGGTASALTINLANGTTLSEVESLLAAIRYKNTSDNPTLNGTDADRNYRIDLSDGNNVQAGGNAGGSTALSASPITGVITITPANDVPINTVPGAQSVNEDGIVNIGGVSVTDPESSLSTVQLSVTHGGVSVSLAGGASLSPGSNGSPTLTLSGTQAQINAALATISYQPTADYHGPAQLTVTSTDSDGGSTISTVAITVTPVVDITPESLTTAEDTPISFNPVTGTNGAIPDSFEGGSPQVTAINGVPITVGGSVTISNGTVTLGANNLLTFTPDVNFNGTVPTFTYTVSSGGATETANIDITVTPINDAPVNSVPIAQITNEDTPLIFSPGNGNAISVADVDSPTLTVTLSVANGVLTLSGITGLTFTAGDGTADGTMTFSGSPADINAALNGLSFVPVADFNGGPFNLTITTFDGSLSDTDTVAITVTPVTDAVSDILITPQNTAISFNPILGTNGANADNFEGGSPQITAINGTPVTAGGSVGVANGSVSLGAGNVLTFTPATGFHGAVPAFTYTVLSGGVTETANIDITVNSPPQAIDNSGSGIQGLPVSGDLLGNDTDPDNNPLTISSYTIDGVPGEFSPGVPVKIPGVGTLVINADGRYSFTPLVDFSGTVPAVNYTITDGQGGFSTAALILKVAASDSVPPDNLWNAGRGFTDPIIIPKPPVVDMTLVPILPVISAVTDANDLNAMTAIGERATHPVLQTVQRIGNMQFFGDRLNGLPGKFAINRGNHTNGPIGQELDRIEHLYAYNDQIERATSGSSSSWETGGLRHSITMPSREAGNANHDHLTVHTTRSGNMLYVEIEHTVTQTPNYDVKRFSARLADGRPLPDWLSFDANSGVLSGLPAAGGEIIKLRVGFELESGKFYSNYVEIETDTARIVEQKNTSSPIQAGADKFTHQIAQSAGHFDAEVTRLRNTLGR